MKTIEDISNELGLDNGGGDWGIENDDPDRVHEFIMYHNSNLNFFDYGIKLNFIELVISSMNEAILENKTDDELDFLFKEYIYQYLNTGDELLCKSIGYWIAIADEEEFPVGFLLDEIVPEDF